MFFRRRKSLNTDVKEAEIQAVRKDTFKKIDKSTRSTKKLIKLLETKGVTENIYDATSGSRRAK